MICEATIDIRVVLENGDVRKITARRLHDGTWTDALNGTRDGIKDLYRSSTPRGVAVAHAYWNELAVAEVFYGSQPTWDGAAEEEINGNGCLRASEYRRGAEAMRAEALRVCETRAHELIEGAAAEWTARGTEAATIASRIYALPLPSFGIDGADETMIGGGDE